jgi:hydroxymethylpyrimidine/phosphomethylpyrimidine kinase
VTRAVALTVAGSDSGGGAGAQADLRTFAALDVFGLSAITAVTAQSTVEVRAVHPVPPEIVRAQIEAVVDDFSPRTVKTGMLWSAATIAIVASIVERARLTAIVDPVMIASSGRVLCEDPEAFAAAMRARLIPAAALVSPNLDEIAALTGRARPRDPGEMEAAARALIALGAKAVLVKGGHLAGTPVDVLVVGTQAVPLAPYPRIASSSTHGTGCVLASAIAAHLARGAEPVDAVERGRRFLHDALVATREAPLLGHGEGPVLR